MKNAEIIARIETIVIQGFGGKLDGEFESAKAAYDHLCRAKEVNEDRTEIGEITLISGEYFDPDQDIACTGVTICRGEEIITCYTFAGGDEISFEEEATKVLQSA